jgi:hypothetical protein
MVLTPIPGQASGVTGEQAGNPHHLYTLEGASLCECDRVSMVRSMLLQVNSSCRTLQVRDPGAAARRIA